MAPSWQSPTPWPKPRPVNRTVSPCRAMENQVELSFHSSRIFLSGNFIPRNEYVALRPEGKYTKLLSASVSGNVIPVFSERYSIQSLRAIAVDQTACKPWRQKV